MYSMEDILSLLHEGQTADDIAKSFTEQLNAAIKVQEEETKAKEAEAKLLADERRDMRTILDLVYKYMNKYCGIESIDITPTDEEIDELINIMTEICSSYLPILKVASKTKSKADTSKPKVTVKTMTADEADKIINDFVKNFWTK